MVRLGKKPDVRSDVFSVGRLLYFALHGEEPQEKDDDTPLLGALEHAPPGLVRIIRRCTLRAPEGRYGRVQEVLRDLENWRDAENVGLKHPQGKEGEQDKDDSSSPGDSDPPSYPDRPSLRPSDSERPGGPSTGERQAPPLPIRSYHAPPLEEDDVLTPLQVRAGAAFGAVVLSAAMLLAYYSGLASNLAVAGTIVGGVALSLVFPPMGAPALSRLVAALCFGIGIWYADPATLLAERGRTARINNAAPENRGVEIAKLKAKGIRSFDGIDFRGANFSDLNLSFMSFSKCDFGGAKFVGAVMQAVKLDGADVTGADFSGADLRGTAVSMAKGWREAICSDTTAMPQDWACDEGVPTPEALLPPPQDDDQ
jgi:hypothetical protein